MEKKKPISKSLVIDGTAFDLDDPYALNSLNIDKIIELLDLYEWHRKDVIRYASVYGSIRKQREKLWDYVDELLTVINRLKFEFESRLTLGI